MFMLKFLTSWDARLVTALRTLEVMIGLFGIGNDTVFCVYAMSCSHSSLMLNILILGICGEVYILLVECATYIINLF